MSASDVGNDIARSMDRASKALKDATKAAMKDAGAVAKAEMLKTATVVPGADRQFSNFKKAGKLGVRVRQENRGNVAATIVLPQGPWSLAEFGRPARGNDPGTARTQGKRSWSKGKDATFDRLSDTVPKQVEEQVERGFRA